MNIQLYRKIVYNGERRNRNGRGKTISTGMETKRLSVNEEDIRIAGDIIRSGGLVAFPTETVYGLGANALDEAAVKSVYAAKGRPSDNPMIVHIAELEELKELIDLPKPFREAYEDAYKIAEALWPGPLTIIFPKSAAVPPVTTGGLDTVAVRMPSNETARALIRSAGCPVAAPSANLSGRPSPTTACDVLEDMDGRIDAVIMGEQCDVGIESTVLAMTGDIPEILRPGAVTAEQLSEVIGKEVIYNRMLFERPAVTIDPALIQSPAGTIDPEKNDTGYPTEGGNIAQNAAAQDGRTPRGSISDPLEYRAERSDAGLSEGKDSSKEIAAFRPKSPGMKYKHYSPKADVILIEGDDGSFKEKIRELCLDAERQDRKAAVLDYGDDPAEAAHSFFADLRELDRQGYDIILVRALRLDGKGLSIMNRMLKSAGYTVIDVN